MTTTPTQEGLRRALALNRTVLICNVSVLIVTFVVALGATDSQVGILESAMRATEPARPRRHVTPDPAPAYLRVVQGLESSAPRDAIGKDQLRCVYSAVQRYYEVVSIGVADTLVAEGGAARDSIAELGREARAEVERELGSAFRDGALVTRLATDILRECR